MEHTVIQAALGLGCAPDLASMPLLHESAMEPQLLQGMSPAEDVLDRELSDVMEEEARPGGGHLFACTVYMLVVCSLTRHCLILFISTEQACLAHSELFTPCLASVLPAECTQQVWCDTRKGCKNILEAHNDQKLGRCGQ